MIQLYEVEGLKKGLDSSRQSHLIQIAGAEAGFFAAKV